MAMVINSNIQSLNAQRHLNSSLVDQNKASERLSSGLRINSAADDAAGLAIANRMTSQVKGLDQAIRNANDGVSLIQTAEGGLAETTNILQRMRELSIQSANGIYDQGNRDTLNAEVEQLKLEIDRISSDTGFNGLSVLDGSLGKVDLQVGENANQTISLEIAKSNTSSLGGNNDVDVIGEAVTAAIVTGIAGLSGDLTINGQTVSNADIGTASSVSNVDDLLAVFADKVAGVKVDTFAEVKAQKDGPNSGVGTGVIAGNQSVTFTTLGTDGSAAGQSYVISDTNSLQEVADKINTLSKGDLSAKIVTDDDGTKRLSVGAEHVASLQVSASGTTTDAALGMTASTAHFSLTMEDTDIPTGESAKIEVSLSLGSTDAALLGVNDRTETTITGGSTIAGTLAADELYINGTSIGVASAATTDALVIAINKEFADTGVTASNVSDQLVLTAEKGKKVDIDQFGGAELKTGLLDTNSSDFQGGSVASIDISTAAGAQKAIEITTNALDEINSIRGDLGAVSNRLAHTVSNLANVSENASAAKSRIMDSDFAAESANLSRAQVLQQAGNAMLAQANSRPQQVLSLLQ